MPPEMACKQESNLHHKNTNISAIFEKLVSQMWTGFFFISLVPVCFLYMYILIVFDKGIMIIEVEVNENEKC